MKDMIFGSGFLLDPSQQTDNHLRKSMSSDLQMSNCVTEEERGRDDARGVSAQACFQNDKHHALRALISSVI